MSVQRVRTEKINFGEIQRSEHPRVIRQHQQQAGQEPCFATDKRYGCRNYKCLLRVDCVKLIAAWLR